jgi:hypothetical protein
MAGSPEDSEVLLVWVGGFGVQQAQLTTAVGELRRHLDWTILGVRLPVDEVARKANNVAGGLHYLTEEAVHAVVRSVGHGQEPFLGGDSRGGMVVLRAGDTGPNRGIAALFPMGLNNEALGSNPLRQGLEIGDRLRRTASDGLLTFWRDRANRGVVAGGIKEAVTMALGGRLLDALGYGFGSDGTESLARKLVAYRDRAGTDTQFDIRLFLAEDDKCFPPEETNVTLQKIGCEGLAVVIKGGHTCVGARAAVAQLAEVGRWLNDTYARQTSLANG